ncbi:hypothetical protein O6H91_06G030600 [Diphasiastrum complanatum]|uniref:Uncharacterized protein n=1 Tax=Diphasiastrum complanatum TaxID=34168 RepID=A0ACC2DCH8_DIPCM|nr:hypothetical protein O6H91_06G030600 [Diphasiastrum complanatum]
MCDNVSGLVGLPSSSLAFENYPSSIEDSWSADDLYSCNEFHMYEECPFDHSGEKARRMDLHQFHYLATTCADFRKEHCKRGEMPMNLHMVFLSAGFIPLDTAHNLVKMEETANAESISLLILQSKYSEQLRILPEAAQAAIESGGPAGDTIECFKGMYCAKQFLLWQI